MFGSPKKAPPNPKDLIKANKRQVQKSQHEIQREIFALERQEKETLLEIKKLAAKGQNSSVRILAKQVVNIRAQKERLQKSHAQLNSLKTAGSAMAANLAVSSAMSGAARAMSVANSATSLESMSSAMQEMEKQMQMSEMAEDMLDGLLEDSDEELEADDVMAQVFDEIGLDLNANLVAAPSKSVKTTGSGVRTRTGAAAARIEEDSSAPPLSAAEEAEADRLLAELTGV